MQLQPARGPDCPAAVDEDCRPPDDGKASSAGCTFTSAPGPSAPWGLLLLTAWALRRRRDARP